MILRKPYAFLIKHFRLIHLLLLIPIGYLILKTNKIVSFFRSYVQNNYSTNILKIASEHINFFMYIAVLVILLVVLAIYYLMRQKEKSTKLYFFILIYYLFLFVLIGFTYNILSTMEHNLITAQTARAYRDISVVLCLPEYFFFIYTLIRGIGFDIKKFNFANDLKNLEIRDIDREEIELNIHIPGYKVERTLRRFLREFKYYILENKFVFSCIFAIVIIFIGTALYLNFGVYNKTYRKTDKMAHNQFTIQITDSMITNLGFDGRIITEGKYYLALQLLIENKTNKSNELDYTNFRLVLNEKNIYPTLDRGEYFIDFGIPYAKEKIGGKTKDYYVLIYEIDEADLTDNYTIKILESIDYKVGEIAAHYKNIKLSPTIINKVENEETVDTSKTLNLKKSTLGYTTFKINSYSIENSYTYTYDYCKNENCQKLTDKVTVDLGGTIEKTTLFILNTDYSLDFNTFYGKNIKNDNDFFDHYFALQYELGKKEYIASLKNRTTNKMQNTIVFETRYDVLNAEKINLLITVRNKQYVIRLK